MKDITQQDVSGALEKRCMDELGSARYKLYWLEWDLEYVKNDLIGIPIEKVKKFHARKQSISQKLMEKYVYSFERSILRRKLRTVCVTYENENGHKETIEGWYEKIEIMEKLNGVIQFIKEQEIKDRILKYRNDDFMERLLYIM